MADHTITLTDEQEAALQWSMGKSNVVITLDDYLQARVSEMANSYLFFQKEEMIQEIVNDLRLKTVEDITSSKASIEEKK